MSFIVGFIINLIKFWATILGYKNTELKMSFIVGFIINLIKFWATIMGYNFELCGQTCDQMTMLQISMMH